MSNEEKPLPSRSAPTLPQLEGRLYRAWTKLNGTLCRDDLETRRADVMDAAADLARRWEWLKGKGLWP